MATCLGSGQRQILDWPKGSGINWCVDNPQQDFGTVHFPTDSANTVYVDSQDQLHLKTSYGNDGIGYTGWLSASLRTAADSNPPIGYGTYITKMVTNPFTMIGSDVSTVMGIFYYKDTYDEIDIEYAKWGKSSNNNLGTLTIHSNPVSNGPYFYINAGNTTNKIVWHSNGNVDYVITDSSGTVLGQWNYTGGWPTHTGSPGAFFFDLWIDTNYPFDGIAREMVLSSFSYVPEGATQILGSVSPPNVIMNSGKTQQFTALDTNGNTISSGVTWSTTGGSISNSGLYTAPTVTTSTNFSIVATYNSIKKNANVTVNPPIVPPPNELLSNTGFETISPTNSSMPANWNTYNSGSIPPHPYIYPVTPGRDGTGKCVSIQFPQKYSGNAAWVQKINVTAGSSYILSVYMKTNNVIVSRGEGAVLLVDWFNGSKWVDLTSVKMITGNTGWTQYAGTVVVPATVTNANVVLRLANASGQVWFDDASFKPKTVQ